MSILATSTPARPAKTAAAERVALTVAAVFVLMAVTQLFSFEDFPEVIYDIWLPGIGRAGSVVAASLLVIGEVLAIPFLLRMRLSPAMRAVSMVAGWLVVLFWLVALAWQNVTPSALTNAGLFGATLALPVGWWAVFYMAGVATLVAWAAWGLWPFAGRRKA